MKQIWAVSVLVSILILGTLGNAYALNSVYLGNNIAQIGDTIAGKTLTGVSEPHIADNGDVVFIGTFSTGSAIFLIPSDGSPASLLAQTGVAIGGAPFDEISDLSISDNGDIVFVGTNGSITVIFTETGVIAQANSGFFGILFVLDPEFNTGVTLSTVGSPSINNNGDVVFVGGIGTGSFPSNHAILLVQPGSPPTNSLLAETGVAIDGFPFSSIHPPYMNNNGDVVFAGTFSFERAIFLIPSGSPPIVLVQTGDIIGIYDIKDLELFLSGQQYSINDNGDVVFVVFSVDGFNGIGESALGFGIFDQTQLLFAAQTPIGGENPFLFRNISINNNGDLLFRGDFLPTGFGIFTQTNLIAGTGDRIDSLTLSDVDAPSMNNNGDVVFVGTGSGPGIYLASIPQISSLQCGTGTTQVGDVCVPSSTLVCGPGTIEDIPNNECIPDPLTTLECGTGTVQEGQICVPESTLTCGAGTIELNNECVPSSTLVCGPGTIEDIPNNECIPDPLTTLECGTGTVQEGQICVPESTLTCGAGTTQVENVCEAVENPGSLNIIAQIQAEIGDIETLVSDDDLKKKDGKKITKKLEKAIKDTLKETCKEMDKFIKEVNKLDDKGKIGQADADSLIQAAQAIKADVGCT